MKRTILIAAFIAVAIGSFVVGRFSYSGKAESSSPKRVLYYVDPMHPSYRSDRPGTAPDCGMALEPVYETGSVPSQVSLAPGAVAISPDKQRLIGVQIEKVERSSGTRIVRTTGRVAVEENSLYRVLTATDGWVRTLHQNPPGTLVKQDEVLATFYSNDFLRAEQSYFFALKSLDRVRSSGRETPEQIKQAEELVRTSEEDLRSLGMGDPQIREIRKKQEVTREINIASPVSGLVIARNLSPSQRLERGSEMYRIADIDKVLILADLFPGISPSIATGSKVRITVRELRKALYASVSSTLPLFDPTSRVLKLRLEAGNPGLLLRPDMFVDIEFTTKVPPGVSIPAEAVLDSGMRKIVYVAAADDVFEPRAIEVGATFDNRVTVTKGLREGDRVVVAGNFMIDSESRMKAAAFPLPSSAAAASAIHMPDSSVAADPVCGMKLSAADLKSAEHSAHYRGRSLVFCSDQCLKTFQQNPEKYANEALVNGRMADTAHGAH